MNILEIISNPIISFFIGILSWQLGTLSYNYIRLGYLAKKNIKKLGNAMGLQLKKYALDRAKEPGLKARISKDLHENGGSFNEGFVLGLDGQTVKYDRSDMKVIIRDLESEINGFSKRPKCSSMGATLRNQ